MGKYRSRAFMDGLRFSCVNMLRANKAKLCIALLLVLVGIFTGIFVAIKSNHNFSLCSLREISLENFYSGFTASASAFGARCFSLTINVVILVGFSFSPFCFPLAGALFTYRAYLFGLNFALIFVFYGFGSIFTAVLIVLPCQLATLAVLIGFYCLLDHTNKTCKQFGRTDCNRWLLILFWFLLVIAINLAETILLCVLSGKVIMVI